MSKPFEITTKATQYEISTRLGRNNPDVFDLSSEALAVLTCLSFNINFDIFPNASVRISNSVVQNRTAIGRDRVGAAIRELKKKEYIHRKTGQYITFFNVDKIMTTQVKRKPSYEIVLDDDWIDSDDNEEPPF